MSQVQILSGCETSSSIGRAFSKKTLLNLPGDLIMRRLKKRYFNGKTPSGVKVRPLNTRLIIEFRKTLFDLPRIFYELMARKGILLRFEKTLFVLPWFTFNIWVDG